MIASAKEFKVLAPLTRVRDASEIAVGALLIDAGTLARGAMDFANQPYGNGWTRLQGVSLRDLAVGVAGAGLRCFYLAGEIDASSFAFSSEKAVKRTMKRLIDEARWMNCNCVEVTRVRVQSFLGVARVRISAHARQIQRDVVMPSR